MLRVKNHTHRKSAFSLVELSVVLVIIGLLIGGVMVGTNLIRAAKVRHVGLELEQLISATHSFAEIYGGFPGDLSNATDIWGAKHSNHATCVTTPATDIRTCNGDGNWRVTSTTTHEYYLYWQHLANAGLIEGQYTAVAGPNANNHHIVGVNSLASRFGNKTGWSIPHLIAFTGNSLFWSRPEDYLHSLMFGAETSNEFTFGNALSVREAWQLDVKVDDGMPGTGRARVINWTACTDAASRDDSATANYDLTNTASAQCGFMFPFVLGMR